MKRLASAAIALALVVPISGAIAGSSSGEDFAFFNPSSGFWTFEGGGSIFYGAPDDLPLLCDWNGDGRATVGVYRDRTGYLLLSNHNGSTVAEYEFYYGIPRDIPLCGDWNGNGEDTIGIYRTSDQSFYLRNTNEFGVGDVEFSFGFSGGMPFSGDWNGDGVDTVGVRDPGNGFMMAAEGHQGGTAMEGYFGSSDQMLVVGDWDGDGIDQFGLYDPAANTLGIAESFFKPVITDTFQLEGKGIPLSGEWNHQTGIAHKSAQEPEQPVNQPAASPGTGPSAPAASAPGTAPPAKIVKPAIPIPSNAVRIDPGTNVQDVVSSHGEGTTFLLGAGIHRMQEIRPKNNQTFIGESGAVLSGARVLDGWQRDGNAWFVGGQSQEGRMHGSCEPGHGRCNRPEELFINDKRMLHVSSRGTVGPGKWFFDYGSDRIFVGDDPAGKRVETSVTEVAFKGQVSGISITGLVIEKYANPAQVGAIDTRNDPSGKTNGSNWVIANNEVRNTHGVGIKATNGSQVIGNYVHHNGQMGLGGGGGSGMLVADNEISYNNAAGYEWGWEGGGTKFAKSRDLVIRNNYSHHNGGPGLWTDIDNINTLYEGNRVMHNDGMGIFHEISYDAVIRNNYLEGNGSGHSDWLWGAGIVVAASRNVEVHGNEVVNNADGIAGIQQNRGSGAHGPYEVSNLNVHDNTVTMTGGHTGFVQDIGDDSYFTSRNNRFSNNRFTLLGDGRNFSWNNGTHTQAEWNGLGQS